MYKNGLFPRFNLIFAFILLVSSGQAFSLTYLGYESFGGTWSDANKSSTNQEDDLMCWAASASNVLAWSGWGNVDGLSSADEIFSYFQAHWTDAGGNPYYGWDWWFDGTSDTQGGKYAKDGWSQVDVAGGGFWTTLTYTDYVDYTDDDGAALSVLDGLLHKGYGVTLSLAGTGAHSITAWGFDYDDNGDYLGIWVTDSDDNLNDLLYYAVAYDGSKWFLQDYYGNDGWYITEVVGLQQQLTSVPLPDPLLPLTISAGIAVVAGTRRHRRRYFLSTTPATI